MTSSINESSLLLGLYCVKTRGKHIRIVVMNNLLPRDVKMNWKYDLKGSTLKRNDSSRHYDSYLLQYNDVIMSHKIEMQIQRNEPKNHPLTKISTSGKFYDSFNLL